MTNRYCSGRPARFRQGSGKVFSQVTPKVTVSTRIPAWTEECDTSCGKVWARFQQGTARFETPARQGFSLVTARIGNHCKWLYQSPLPLDRMTLPAQARGHGHSLSGKVARQGLGQGPVRANVHHC